MRRREGRHIVDDETWEIIGPAKSERFTKSMVEVWRQVNKCNLFTPSEEKTLHRLSMFLQLNTNALVTPNGEYMTIERMADETGIDRSNIRKYVKELMRKNALGKWSSNGREIFYINPFLYQSGDVKPYLFNLFDEEYHERCKTEHLSRFKAGKKQTSLIAAQ
ncbi:hypothetical protein [Paenibacillus oleatilyticus]|uniref:hypothetical protein n=1 Tax=Paenibacillus oleatilyticus TaxID=2594886 RepID=UPI001C1F5CFD|nr:hypothetical protein [Paenibacillus oleatilyticus]MBU7314064.1 hypothetical protein [Paenibacillus oleatilyticus]